MRKSKTICSGIDCRTSIYLLSALLVIVIFMGAFMNNKSPKHKEGLTNSTELILLHMKGCPHCVTLMPEWESATKENQTTIPLRAIERSEPEGKKLCKQHNVTGFPTILLLKNGKKETEYNGERNKGGILKFLEGK